jgi:quinol monooxygenase YgiN
MVRLTVVLAASHRRGHELVQTLRSLMAHARLQPGCITCHVWSDLESNVRYVEEWATEMDLERRVRSDRFTWLLAVIEASEEPPDVRFDFFTLSRGLDYVEQIRQQQPS